MDSKQLEKVFGKVLLDGLRQRGIRDLPDDPSSMAHDMVHLMATRVPPEVLPDVVQEAALVLLTKVLPKLGPAHSYDEARSYVAKSLINHCWVTLRAMHRGDNRYVTWQLETDDEGEVPGDVRVPDNPLEGLDDKDLPILLKRLTEVHPDAPRYVELMFKGFDEKDIVGDYREDIPSLLPHLAMKPITPQAWNQRYKPRIQAVLREFLVTI